MVTAVLSHNGTALAPAHNIEKVRRLLQSGRAKIVCHDPFAIRLSYDPAHPMTEATASETS